MLFGERLKQLREGKYSQEELAEKLNVNNNTISKWETGQQEPRARKVRELAEILGTTPSYLLGDNDEPSRSPVVPIKENSTSTEKNINRAVLTLNGGERVEAPATPEGYAFLERMLMMSLGSAHTASATA